MENPYDEVSKSSDFEKNMGRAALGDFSSLSDGLEANSVAQAELYRSKGWVRFLSVICFIYFGVMAVAAIWVTVMSLAVAGGSAFFVVLIIIVMGFVVFRVALVMSLISSALKRLEGSRSFWDLEAVMGENLKVWRIVGILSLLGVVLRFLKL